jgi:CheY-like chemotaxis protein
MDRDTLQHFFEPFYTTKGPDQGTGLGLAVVHGIVKQHGGHITCYSEPGQGTTFKIYFPALIAEGKADAAVLAEMPPGGNETILLVDDDKLIRDLGSRILTKAGYKVITASDGEEALKTYQGQGAEIALVVLDVIMPNMGGKECLEAILRLNPSVKIVMASGYSSYGPIEEAPTLGAKGFIRKPYQVRQLLEAIRRALDVE